MHRARLYRRVLTGWSMGLGDAYVDGDWDCDRLDELFARLLGSGVGDQVVGPARLRLLGERLRHSLLNLQSR